MATATPRMVKETQMVEQVVEVIDGVTLELSKNEAEYVLSILGEFNGTVSGAAGFGHDTNTSIFYALWHAIGSPKVNYERISRTRKAMKDFLG
jgi:hypothetical protein